MPLDLTPAEEEPATNPEGPEPTNGTPGNPATQVGEKRKQQEPSSPAPTPASTATAGPDLHLDEVRLLDIQLGWDVFEICQAHEEIKLHPPTPPTFPDLATLTEAQVAEWTRAARFHRNGGDDSAVRAATLTERVALTLIEQDPELTAAEALRRVTTTVQHLRQGLLQTIQAADALPTEPEPGPEINLTVAPAGPPPFDLSGFPTPDLMEYQIEDVDVAYYLKTGELPVYANLNSDQRKEKRRNIRDRAKNYHHQDDRLYRLSVPKPHLNEPPPPKAILRPVLTKLEADSLIHHLHDLNGHPSVNQTYKLIGDRFWWKSMKRDVKQYVSSCHACQLANKPTTERTDGRSLTPTETDRPWEKVGLDLLGPFPTTGRDHYRYVALAEDYHTHYLLGAPLRSSKTEEVAEFLRRDLFSHHGSPAVMTMDNALSVGAVKELCEEKGTKIQSLPAYSPWINGLAESAVKHCKRGIRKLRHQYGEEWPRYFHDLLFAHRICVRSSTLFSSFKMVYGREPVLAVERMFAQRYQVQLASTDEEVDAVTERCLEDIIATRRLNTLLRATRQELLSRSAAFNQDVRQQHAIEAFRKRQHRGAYRTDQLEPGCKVIMRKTRKGHPLDLGFEGPYKFVGYMDENAQVAILEDINQLRWTRHVTLIHLYREGAAAGE